MNDLVLHRATTPVTYETAHRLAAMPPLYGISAVADANTFLPDGYEPPTPPVLDAMHAELMQAMVPCTRAQAAKAAASIIAAYPQNDNTTSAYAHHLAQRLADCPPDLLDAVINRVIDESPDFRPGAGRVGQAVKREVAKRAILLQRIESAQRWWQQQAERQRVAAEAADYRAMRAAGIAGELSAAWTPPSMRASAIPQPIGEKPLAPRPSLAAHLSGDELAAARQRVGVSAMPQTSDQPKG